jgi:multicomponent Na+:H+ antiporter subunit E
MPERMEKILHTSVSGTGNTGRSAAIRVAAFFILWLVLLPSLKVGDLMFGAVAASAATWLSLHLSPPANGGLRVGRLLLVLPHFLLESTRGGIDVALRALAPRLPIRPGLFTYGARFPSGLARNTFASITSLLPGTLACGEADGKIVYHGLDLEQPVNEQLREEERRLTAALMAGGDHE